MSLQLLLSQKNRKWTPDLIRGSGYGLTAWYDAKDSKTIVLNGSNVSTWSDKSGNGNDMNQVTAGNQPLYTYSSLPYIGVNSSSGTVGLTSTKSFSTKQIYSVIQYGDGTPATFSASDTMISGPGGLGVERGIMTNVGTASLNSGSTFDNGVAQKNGNTESAIVLPMPWSVITSNCYALITQVWNVGCNMQTSGRTWNGYYREFIFLSVTADITLQRKIEGYLAWKWGTQESLAVGHPYKYKIPTI